MTDEDSVRRVQKVKYLRLEVDENLTWNEQYKCLKNKIKCGLSSIRKLATILLQTKLEQVYRALVESHLRYGNELWGTIPDKSPGTLCTFCSLQQTFIPLSP